MEYNILLIDDDVDEFILLASAKKYFPEISFHYAKNAETGLSFIENKKPDLVFLDINMPGIDGFECLRLIRKNVLSHDLPVILYSTGLCEDSQKKAIEMGASGCMQKPVSLNGLRTGIIKVLDLMNYNMKMTK